MGATGETHISDVVVPEVFTPYMLERSLNQNRFFQSGVMTPVPAIDMFLRGGGRTAEIPYWKDLTADIDVPVEDTDMTIYPITSGHMHVRRQVRERALGSNDVSAALAGDNPYEAILQRISGLWAKALEDLAIYSVRGCMLDNVDGDSSDLVHDISIADGDNATDDNKISSTATIESVMKQGDEFQSIVAVAMHSMVYKTLVDNDLIDYKADSEGRLVIPYYMGLRLIVSDNMYRVASTTGYKYHSYFFKAGALGWGSYAGPYKEVEIWRNPLKGGGVDVLITRRQFAIHPLGFSWEASETTEISPTDAVLYAETSWDRPFAAKNTGVVALITNG
jgi:hypothetical protein